MCQLNWCVYFLINSEFYQLLEAYIRSQIKINFRMLGALIIQTLYLNLPNLFEILCSLLSLASSPNPEWAPFIKKLQLVFRWYCMLGLTGYDIEFCSFFLFDILFFSFTFAHVFLQAFALHFKRIIFNKNASNKRICNTVLYH